MRIAIFASGRGSNLLAVHDAVLCGKLPDVTLDLAVCDQPDAPVIEHLHKRNIQNFVFSADKYLNKVEFETLIEDRLELAGIELVILAGYMRLVGPTLLEKWEGRMLNLHPSLLPAFPGKKAVNRAWSAAVKETGVTVHFVDAGIDTGQIFLQQKVSISPDDTEATLSKKIQAVEHQLLPEAIRKFQKIHA